MKRFAIACCLLLWLSPGYTSAQTIHWQDFNAMVFAKARAEHKLVLLDLKANWCHWCHVMDDSTYSNPAVQRYLQSHFITVQADQDKRPDLATRYKDYGWPATIIFTANGGEIDKQAGFMAPDEFLGILRSAVKKPVADKVTATAVRKGKASTDPTPVIRSLKDKFYGSLDFSGGGFDFEQKYIDFDTYEYALSKRHQDSTLDHWVKISTQQAAASLMDTVWGGVYQYSTYSDWQHAHFEKLLTVQARYVKMFSWYANVYQAPWALQAAKLTAKYCDDFLKANDSAYFNAQDADAIQGEKATAYFKLNDAARRQQGIPAVDKHIYTNVNAQLAESLLVLWAASGEEGYRTKALRVLRFLQLHHQAANGGFYHGDAADPLFSLSDQLYMARALLYAYRATNDTAYLNASTRTADFISQHFASENGAYNSYAGNNGLAPQPVVAENIDLCRFFNLLSYTADKPAFKTSAQKILSYLLSASVQEDISTEPGMLSAADEAGKEPLSATLLFYGQTPDTEKMLQETLASPVFYLLNHTYRNLEAVPEEKKDMFSGFDKPVLFFCNTNYCSAPVYNSKAVEEYLAK